MRNWRQLSNCFCAALNGEHSGMTRHIAPDVRLKSLAALIG